MVAIVKPAAWDGAAFDLRKLKARDMAALAKAEKTMDIDKMAEILATCVVAIPGVEDVKLEETYLDMPFVDLMLLLRELGKAIAGELQK